MTVIEHPIWDGHGALALPELTGEVRADVCVIGLGGSGLACIHALDAAGRSVVGIDALTVAAAAAGRNGGFLLGGLAMFHHDAVERLGRRTAASIYEETLTEIGRIAEQTPDAVRRTGSLRIAIGAEEAVDCRAQYDAMQRDGLPVERYDGPEGGGCSSPPMRRSIRPSAA